MAREESDADIFIFIRLFISTLFDATVGFIHKVRNPSNLCFDLYTSKIKRNVFLSKCI